MKKEDRIENERQQKEGKINDLIAKLQAEKEEVQEKISGLERKRPVLYAKVVLKQQKAKERGNLEAKLNRLQDRERRLVFTVRGLKEMLKELEGVRQSLTYFKEDREKFEELKGFIKIAMNFKPMWDETIETWGEVKARSSLVNYISEQNHLMMVPRYVTELVGLAKELDAEADLREFVYQTTGKPLESFLDE